jgi:serine/threonine protein kinase
MSGATRTTTPTPTASVAKRCRSCAIKNKIMAHHQHKKSAVKHAVSAARLDTRLLRELPISKSGLVSKKRKLWRGFNKSTVYLEIKSSYALVFRPNVRTQAQADDAVPHKVYALHGASVTPNQSSTTGVPTTPSHSSHHSFSILFADGQERSFSVQSAAERDAWSQTITEAAAGPCFGDLRKVARLGAGHFGKVFLAVHKPTGALVAMKQVNRAGGKQSRMIHERAVVQRITEIGSRFVSRTLMALREPTSGDLVYVNELHTGGDLWGLIRQVHRVDATTVRFIAAEVALGIQRLHDYGIMHRDIKLENIMLDSQGHMKLIDFGLSMCLKPVEITGDMLTGSLMNSTSTTTMAPMYQRTFSVCGTNYYMPPEMLTGGHGHGLSLDWWQLGCLVYELLVGRPAFFEVGAAKIHAKVLAGPPSFPPSDVIDIPDEAKDLILSLLKHDSTMRLGASGCAAVMAHPFFSGVDWTDAANGELAVPQVLVEHVSMNASKTTDLDLSSEAAAAAAISASDSHESSSASEQGASSDVSTADTSDDSNNLDLDALRKAEFKRHSTTTQTPASWHALDQLVRHFPDATDVDGGKFSVLEGVRKLSVGADCTRDNEQGSSSSGSGSGRSSRSSGGGVLGGSCKSKLNRVSSCPSYHALSTTTRNILLPNDAYLGFDYLASSDVLNACVEETRAIGIVPHADFHQNKYFGARMQSSGSSVSATSSRGAMAGVY